MNSTLKLESVEIQADPPDDADVRKAFVGRSEYLSRPGTIAASWRYRYRALYEETYKAVTAGEITLPQALFNIFVQWNSQAMLEDGLGALGDVHSAEISALPTVPCPRDAGTTGLSIHRTDEGTLLVSGMAPGSPAERSGDISVGDELVAINGVCIEGIDMEGIAALIVGEVGQEVFLRLRGPSPDRRPDADGGGGVFGGGGGPAAREVAAVAAVASAGPPRGPEREVRLVREPFAQEDEDEDEDEDGFGADDEEDMRSGQDHRGEDGELSPARRAWSSIRWLGVGETEEKDLVLKVEELHQRQL